MACDKYFIFSISWLVCHSLYLYLTVTKVIYIPSRISRGLEFYSVNHTFFNSELKALKNKNVPSKYLISDESIWINI